MALISFDPSLNDQLKERNQLLAELNAKNKTRFNYPNADQQYQFDQLNNLLPFKWDNIDAPLLSIATSYSRDVIPHKFVGVGGASLEDTGRNALIIKTDIIFVNSISPGGNEGWTQGTLYPDIYNKYLNSLINYSTGSTSRPLNHPQLGEIQCKVISFETNIISSYRGGGVISAVFMEDGLDTQQNSGLFSQLNKTSDDIVLLNTYTGELLPDPLALQIQPVALGLTGLLNSVKTIIDQGGLIGQDALGTLQSMSYRCNSIINAVKINNNILYAKVLQTAYMVRADSLFLAQKFQSDIPVKINKSTSIYRVPAIVTLAAVAQTLNSSVSDLISLNPQLLSTPFIRMGTLITYYTGGTNISAQLPNTNV